MGPRETLYRIAVNSADYRRCRTLMAEKTPLAWPTVMAEREGRVLGFLSTNPTKQAIVAGPLINIGHALISLRLIEAYENVLRLAGVTFYYFAVHQGNGDARWRRILHKLDFQPYTQDSESFWYLRRLS